MVKGSWPASCQRTSRSHLRERCRGGELFEVVVGPIGTEGGELGVGDYGEGNGVAFLLVGSERFGEFGTGLGAHGDDFEARFAKFLHLGGEGLELLDAMQATETEVEDHHDGAASIVGERAVLAGGIGKLPGRGRSGLPAEGPEVVEVGKGVVGGIVGVGFKLGAPVLGQTEAFGDGSEAGEDGGGQVDGLPQFTKLPEGLFGLLGFAGESSRYAAWAAGKADCGGLATRPAAIFAASSFWPTAR